MRSRTPLTSPKSTSPKKHPARDVKGATLQNANNVKPRSTERDPIHEHGPFVERPVSVRPPFLWLQDLECVRKLGTGSSGCVLLVRVRRRQEPHRIERPGSLFALKVLLKEDVQHLEERCPGDAGAERECLCKLPWSPWINGAIGAFHDPFNLYLMLECIPAGVLHDLIYRRGPLDATMARFYYASIVCALEFLHLHGIVHRDLKPANILIKPDGYISLVDFGVSTHLADTRPWTLMGTPGYMAPESFMDMPGLGCGVDWFSSGVILYEMVTRRMPFSVKEEGGVYTASKLYKWPRELRVGKSLKSLVAALLTHEPMGRLGIAKPTKDHQWLSGIDWDKMNGQSYIAPWVPGEPHLTQMWQDKQTPPQARIPGLEVVTPPVYLRYDRRSRRKQEARTDSST